MIRAAIIFARQQSIVFASGGQLLSPALHQSSVTKQTAASPAMIQFLLISKSPTTEHQFGRSPFGPVE